MRYIWALGLIASGQAAVMAGGLAGQTVMLGFLNLRVSKWKVPREKTNDMNRMPLYSICQIEYGTHGCVFCLNE